MSGLCLGVAFSVVIVTVPVQTFTLAWTHSVEKIRWEEDYRIEKNMLSLVAYRVRGSGAGMEPGPDAVLHNGVYESQIHNMFLDKLTLARSTYTTDYELCWDDRCRTLQALAGPAQSDRIDLFPCVLGSR
jgi:hypothetical protein